MPRISSGGPSPEPNDDQITRVDIAPEDIRKMSDEQLHELLASIRNKRETSVPRASRVKGSATSRAPKETELGDEGDLE